MLDKKVYAESLVDRQKHLLLRRSRPDPGLNLELQSIYRSACNENAEFPAYFIEHCENQGVKNE